MTAFLMCLDRMSIERREVPGGAPDAEHLANLRDYQICFVNAMVEACRSTKDRFWASMPCGTGKSRCFFGLLHHEKPQLACIVVPLLQLIKQFKSECDELETSYRPKVTDKLAPGWWWNSGIYVSANVFFYASSCTWHLILFRAEQQ